MSKKGKDINGFGMSDLKLKEGNMNVGMTLERTPEIELKPRYVPIPEPYRYNLKETLGDPVISDYIKSYRSSENHTIIKPGNFVPISYYDPENQAANVNAESFDKNVRKKTKRLLENIKRFK